MMRGDPVVPKANAMSLNTSSSITRHAKTERLSIYARPVVSLGGLLLGCLYALRRT